MNHKVTMRKIVTDIQRAEKTIRKLKKGKTKAQIKQMNLQLKRLKTLELAARPFCSGGGMYIVLDPSGGER